jgi:hypothetical protein
MFYTFRLVSLFVLNVLVRVVATATGSGWVVVYGWGFLLSPFTGESASDYMGTQQRTYRLLQYGGFGDVVLTQVFEQLWSRVMMVVRHPGSWLVMALLSALSIALQYSDRKDTPTDSAAQAPPAPFVEPLAPAAASKPKGL